MKRINNNVVFPINFLMILLFCFKIQSKKCNIFSEIYWSVTINKSEILAFDETKVKLKCVCFL